MHFHPQKCPTMHITNKRNIIQSTYTIHNPNLQTANTAKYIGIHIHSTLNWNTHINKTAQRAKTTSAFLHRNIRTCPRKTKHLAYTTLVRPILEYASIIWDPHTASNIHKLETLQRRSARHIMHNYNRHANVTTMRQHLHLPTLQQRRHHFKVITLYRITHQLASIPTATYITPSTRNTQHYILPYARTHVFKTSFSLITIKIWNNLQPVITNSTTIPQLSKRCNPHQHSVGVGLHAQLGLSGHITLTSVISYTCTTKHQIMQPIPNTPGIIVLMLSYLLPIRWQDHTVVSDHTVSNLSPNNTKSYI